MSVSKNIEDRGDSCVRLYKKVFKAYLLEGFVLESRDREAFINQWESANSNNGFSIDYKLEVLNN